MTASQSHPLVGPESPGLGKGADAPSRQESAPGAAEVSRAIHASFSRQFRQILTLLVVLLLWLLVTELLTLESGQPHYIWDQLASLVFLAGLRAGVSRRDLSLTALQSMGAAVVALLTANALHFVLTYPGPHTVTPLIFILVISGSLFVAVRWYVPVLMATIVVWTLFAWPIMTSMEREEYGAMTVVFASVSAFGFYYRTRTQANLESLRVVEQKQKQELHRALNVAHEELVERETSEAALRESEERYRHVVERSPVAIVLHDTERITLANDALARLIGLPSAEACVGLKIDEFIHPESRDFLAERSRTVLERHESTPPGDIRIVSVDGAVREAEVTAQLVSLRGRPMVQAVLQDVTERRIADRALRQSEERYRLLAENLTDGIWTADFDLHFDYFSPSVAKMLRMSMKELRDIPLGGLLDDEQIQAIKQILAEELHQARQHGAEALDSRSLELEVKRGDGTRGWFDVSFKLLFDSEGKPSGVQGVCRDISERRRAEEELRRSEERYRLLAENVSDIIWTSDFDFNYSYLSPAIERIFGLPTEACMKVPIERTMTADSLVRVRGALEHQLELARRRLDYEATWMLELEMFHADSTPKWVEVQYNILRGQDGMPASLLGVTREITERKEAEERLRKSKESYRLLADNVTDVIWKADLDLRFTYISPSFESIFRVPADQALDIPVERMMSPESLEYARRVLNEMVEEVRKDGPAIARERTLELQFVRGDGSPVWSEVKARVLCDASGEPSAVLGVTRDITERRRAEEDLRQSEERFRLLAEHATDVIFTSDLHLKFTFLSPAATRLFGYATDEIDQCSPELLLAPGSLEQVKASLKEELDREGIENVDPFRSRTFELEYLTKDGGTVWTEVKVSFLRDPNGMPTGLVGVIRDISERLRAQEEKARLEAQLAQAQKLEAIGTLAGGIAHDFNNLLTGILGYADLLKLEAQEGDPVYESAEIIQTAATRARELTGQLLGFARKGKHRNAPVDLNETIGEVVQLLNRTLDKNIEIETDLDSAPAVILGDPAQIQQIVLNLALNARDAMPEGGVLRFHTQLDTLNAGDPSSSGVSTGAPVVTLAIGDTGSGIPPELRDRIFEPFFTTKEPGKGTGMGLAMVYGIVKNHGGVVELESEVGRGTEFRLRFPAASWAPELPSEESSRDLVRGFGRILIVDDEAVVRRMAGEMLRYLGYEVTTMGDSREALDYYREHYSEIDLVLIDMIMPGLGGRECFRAMKEINPEVRAVLSSGYGQNAAAQKIIDDGVQGFIQKPYEVDRLSKTIARVLAA